MPVSSVSNNVYSSHPVGIIGEVETKNMIETQMPRKVNRLNLKIGRKLMAVGITAGMYDVGAISTSLPEK